MDDCNENVQAEIKYRIASSDSSMDDCNAYSHVFRNTFIAFRFLYGRL